MQCAVRNWIHNGITPRPRCTTFCCKSERHCWIKMNVCFDFIVIRVSREAHATNECNFTQLEQIRTTVKHKKWGRSPSSKHRELQENILHKWPSSSVASAVLLTNSTVQIVIWTSYAVLQHCQCTYAAEEKFKLREDLSDTKICTRTECTKRGRWSNTLIRIGPRSIQNFLKR